MSKPMRRLVGRMIPPSTPARGYVEVVAMLVVLALAAFGYLGLFGCGGFSPQNTANAFEPDVVARPQISGSATYQYGQRQSVEFYCSQVGDEPAEQVTIHWSPPGGATEFQFAEGRQPDNVETGPPFVWNNVLWDQARETFNVTYMPPAETLLGVDRNVDAVVVYDIEGASRAATLWSWPSRTDAISSAYFAQAKPAAALDTAVWEVTRWVDSADNQPLNLETANGMLEALRQGVVFVAVKVAGAPGVLEGHSEALSWVTDDAHPAQLAIFAWGSGGENKAPALRSALALPRC